MGSSGESSSNQTTIQQQTTDPYAPTKPILQNIFAQLQGINPNLTGAESGALDQLGQNGGNQFANQIGGVAGGLLGGGGAMNYAGMVGDANTKYQGAMDPFASGQYVDPASNPALQKYLQVARDDVGNSVNSMFAGAGRDLSGAHMQAYGRGVGQAEAPILYDAYNQARNQQLGAIQGQYGAATGTAGILGGMQQQGNANRMAGIDASNAATSAKNSGALATLEAEAQRRNIPMQTLAQMMGLTLPAAGGLGTTTSWGKQDGTQKKSLADTFNTWTQGFNNISNMFKVPNGSKIAGM